MRRLALCAVALWAGGAGAAELPSRAVKVKPAEERARACEIGGQRGVAFSYGACLRISGYVSVGAATGRVKH